MRICLEPEAFSGVRKIAGKVAHDIFLITGKEPVTDTWMPQNEIFNQPEKAKKDGWTILAATIGKSTYLDGLLKKEKPELKKIQGKRECYSFFFPEGDSSFLVIAGSDKRGTIYGLFHLSELLGVSPFVDWCGLLPPKKYRVELDLSMACSSKEPSVKYRGFFINDEWPAFGNWCTHRFGGFNAEAYEHVFELLLRLKGNYLWPAMWSARFMDDGPGLLNAELADEYGVVMGMSHHEPCLRQGEEYKYLRGKDSIYGDAWNFVTNREGVTRFWEDGLKRSGRFENVITVGMRGEADTAIMGKDATLADNIALLRDVLSTQRKLIKEHVNEDLSKVPRMIALYKEVEEFFYGNEETKGLIGSEELEDVILMLCDDNYGNLRTLPTEQMRKHKGGYGMYYHFDYHGWPVSYEWINSSYLPKVWEQMTQAYDFGVRDLWIVNVGDIATQEFPLSFFLDLAYDFDQWGTENKNCTDQYTKLWVRKQFGALPETMQEEMADVLFQYTRLIHKRRPEALDASVYHPVNYREGEKVKKEAQAVFDAVRTLYERMERNFPELLSAFEALIYYPAAGTMNLLIMQLNAGMNHYLAEIGALSANDYGKDVEQGMKADQAIVRHYHHMDDMRWYGMGLSTHIGFTNWNEDECKNPQMVRVFPLEKPSVVVTIEGTTQHKEGSPWLDNRMTMKDFCDLDCKEAGIVVYSRSTKESRVTVADKPDWIRIDPMECILDGAENKSRRLCVTVDRGVLQGKKDAEEDPGMQKEGVIRLLTPAGECQIVVSVAVGKYSCPKHTFVDTMGYLAMAAEHYVKKQDGLSAADAKEARVQMEFSCLTGYGKTLSAMKAFPTTAYADPLDQAPYLEYQFVLSEGGSYEAQIFMQPSNPVKKDNRLCYAVQVNDGEIVTENAIEPEFRVGDQGMVWAKGVLDQIRIKSTTITCRKGKNTLRIYPVTPGFVLERIVISPEGMALPESYFGPPETCYMK